jgi:hypothetical protein
VRNLERVSLYFNEWRYLQGARRRTVVAQRRTYEEFVRSLIEPAQQEGNIDPSLNVEYRPRLCTRRGGPGARRAAALSSRLRTHPPVPGSVPNVLSTRAPRRTSPALATVRW